MDARKLGQFIAQLRKEQNMTQTDLADKLHVTDKAISKWERGVGLPGINSIEPLAEALGVSIAEVMKAERIATGQVTEENASQLLTSAFDIVKQQRKTERTHILLILSAITAALIVLILGPTATAVVPLPCLCILGGISLFIYGFWRRKNQLHAMCTFVLAAILLLLPFAFALLLFMAGYLGIGPVPV